MDRRSFCIGALSLPAMMRTALAGDYGEESAHRTPAVWGNNREIRFVLHDPLEHPFYWWPRTLLSYSVEFQSPADINRLQLTRADTQEQVPIQFSEIIQGKEGPSSAVLHFFSDLPSGGHREFILTAAGAAIHHAAQVREQHEGNTIVLDSGAMRVRIPATQDVHGVAPGPILQVSRGGQWVGASSFVIPGDRVTRIVANRVAGGPLFLSYELSYETDGGSRYVAVIQCNGGQDFVYLRENMDGLRPGTSGTIETTWTGFDVTHRQTPNHPAPVPEHMRAYDDYAWERIDQPSPERDVRLGSSVPVYPEVLAEGELPVKLGIYQASTASIVGTSATFWAQGSGDALGVFIDKSAAWCDHEYAYEVEAPTLQVSYYYQEGRFDWKWPLARGRRSTCIAFYDHDKDKQAMRQLEEDARGVAEDGLSYQVLFNFTSHAMFLRNRYGTLDLNCVKDWVLTYPEDAHRPAVIFADGTMNDATEFVRSILTSNYVCTLPVTGTCEDGGFNPVRARHILDWWIGDFNRLNAAMTARQRARVTAVFLIVAYVHAGDDFMPLVPMLGGHPNFFGDVKSAVPAMSFLFPDHPMARAWIEMWQKGIELTTHYNTRPPVQTWNARGGRWTEDLGTYVWAFLRPTLRADFLLRKYDGVERFVTPQLAQMADWLVNALSAPFDGETEEAYRALKTLDYGHEWGALAPGMGPRRVHPPIGAHSERRIPARSLWYLGACLQHFAPLAAEHAMWAARPTNQDMETPPKNVPPWNDIMYRAPDNRGTNPHLRSSKYTGYGVVLRAAVDTPEEISVHLQQIDEGPNYRWGRAAEGGCGVIYFFAAGKAYSFNGSEDQGDRRDQDTDFCTNFGVYKDGEFRAVGQNVLSRPLYDLGHGQFAEIVPRQGPSPYSSPEYLGRSILLAGHDYFVLYDAVLEPSIQHRLSWFVRRGSPLPSIVLVRGASGDARQTHRTEISGDATTGVWFDGEGDSMAVVSHRKDLDVEGTPYGCRVHADAIDDWVFRNPQAIHFSDGGLMFDGTAGLIRRTADGYKFAMFHGTRIAVPGIEFSTTDAELGVSGAIASGVAPRGEYDAPQAFTLAIVTPSLSPGQRFYIDGEEQSGQSSARGVVFNLKAGHHQWELTGGLPVPVAPRIERTENRAAGARVFIAPVASATTYRLEMSRDDGATWSQVGVQSTPAVELNELANGDKVHLRAVALNAEHESLPGPEYPLYVTADPPPPPDGLRVELADGAATLTWGEILGVTEYRLYARAANGEKFALLYRGRDRVYCHKHASIRAALPSPAPDATVPTDLFEYCVTAVNGNGEGARSACADTNPSSWRNWDPRPGERFRRVYSFPPDTPQSQDSLPRYYPE